MAGVYVHLPFCPYICPYCDFAKWPFRRSSADRYVRALIAEIECTLPIACDTLFFGGGTPNTLDAKTIAQLIARTCSRFALASDAEISLEVNPDLALCESFNEYVEAGATRLSIGVQSFNAGELQTLGRAHTASDVEKVIDRARRAGFANISLDLIFGVPGQTLASWESSVRCAIDFGIDHCSTYGLTIEEETPYAAWFAREPSAFASDSLEADQYAAAIALLGASGFEHYEISNFARPGRRCRHNENYWANGEYVGLGVGAASYRAGVRRVNTRDFEEYVTAALEGSPIGGEEERLTGPAQLGEAIMLALRTLQGVDLRSFRERYGVDVLERYTAQIAEMRDNGMISVSDSNVALTAAGRFLANDVCAAFIA